MNGILEQGAIYAEHQNNYYIKFDCNYIYLLELLSKEKDVISAKHLDYFFMIDSLTGVAFDRLFKAIFGVTLYEYCNNNELVIRYNDIEGLLWTDHRIQVSGHDIVSLYALIEKIPLKESIELIYKHLQNNEYENSFSSKDKKSYWTFEESPLRKIQVSKSINDIIRFFEPKVQKNYDSSTVKCLINKQNLNFSLYTKELLTITLTLWKNKNGDLRWFAKEKPNIEQSSPTKNIEKTHTRRLIKAGEKIPGADIERKMILSPLIESGYETWLFGPEKSHKSRLARTLAQVIAYGGKFLDKYEASPGLSVLYIDCEFYPDKFDKYCNKELNGLDYTQGRKFDLIQAKSPENPNGEINLLDEEWVEIINAAIEESDIVFLDCYYRLADGKISPKKLLEFITPWKNKGKAFVIVDHANRDDDLQGSIDKSRNADLCIKITKIDNNNIKLSFPTARYLNFEESTPLRLKVNFEEDKTYFSLCEPVEVKVEVSDDTKRQMLAYMLVQDYKLKPEGDLEELFEYGKSTIYKWLSSFSKANMQPHENEQYQKYKNMPLGDLKAEANRLKKSK